MIINPTMTTAQINKALKNNREITFTKGTYTLKKPLVLYSNTKVTCENGVHFERIHAGRMVELYVTPETTKYNGVKNVTWEGGYFSASGNDTPANVITLFHGKSITIKDVTIGYCEGLHSIEINACKTVEIQGCRFETQTDKGGDKFREVIQIDFAHKDGLSIKGAAGTSPCYDGTHCKDIFIRGCIFDNCPNAIGTHTVGEKEEYHKTITIWNCTFMGVRRNAVQLYGMKDVTIRLLPERGDVIVVGELKTAHKLEGGKVKLKEPRGNKHVQIISGNNTAIIE